MGRLTEGIQPTSTPQTNNVFEQVTSQPSTGGGRLASGRLTPAETTGGRITDNDKKKLTKWQWVSKQLMKPTGSVAAEIEALGTFIGTGKKYTPGKQALDVLTGKEEASFSDIWNTHYVKPMEEAGASKTLINSGKAIGFITDIAADPLNFIGGGLTKVGKIAEKVTSLTNAGRKIQKGSKLWKAAQKTGLSLDELTLLSTKAEQAGAGQRAFLQAFGKPLIKGEAFYKTTGKVSEAFKATGFANTLRKTFTTKTGNKQLDELVEGFNNLSDFRKNEVIETAGKVQKDIAKFKPVEVKQVVDLIENPSIVANITNTKVKNTAEALESLFKEMKVVEKEKGLLTKEIAQYFPRIKAKQALPERIKNFFSPKVYNKNLGASGEREIMKLIKPDGSEIIGSYKKLGLKKVNKVSLINKLEDAGAKKVGALQKALNKLAQPEVNLLTGDLQEIITTLKKNTSKEQIIGATQDLIEPTYKELDNIVKSIINPKRDELELVIKDLETIMKGSQGKEFFKPVLGFKNTRESKIKFIHDEILKTQNAISDSIAKIEGQDFVDAAGNFFKRGTDTISEINEAFGKEFFQTNPAIAYAQRGLASAKATTAKEFLDEVGKKFFTNAEDAPFSYIESTNPLFKGLKASPEVVETVDKYIQGIKPDELKAVIRGFDSVQNWWKGQVLISPSYHVRNMVGNFWNNWLAGVKNPVKYAQAKQVQSKKLRNGFKMVTASGEELTGQQIINMAKKENVIGRGLYGAEIEHILADEVKGNWGRSLGKALTFDGWKPWKRDNWLISSNRVVGEAIEDNARLAHFIDKLEKGHSALDAGRSVKKFLFDYADLSKTEQNIFKRIAPFYTWTRKNVPLQIENMVTQPAKFAAIPKAIEAIELESEAPDPRTEKYMSEYITENVPVRIRTTEKGNTEYFLLGNWLPSAQAIDFLSQPFENLVNMATPALKTPYELWANKSFFFRNTLGEPSKIEYYYKQPTEFVGKGMRRKTAHVLRNIRIMNDINKIVQKGDKESPDNSPWVKLLNVFFGKAATFDPELSGRFFKRETQDRISEFKRAIKAAERNNQIKQSKKLQQELKEFKEERSQ